MKNIEIRLKEKDAYTIYNIVCDFWNHVAEVHMYYLIQGYPFRGGEILNNLYTDTNEILHTFQDYFDLKEEALKESLEMWCIDLVDYITNDIISLSISLSDLAILKNILVLYKDHFESGYSGAVELDYKNIINYFTDLIEGEE